MYIEELSITDASLINLAQLADVLAESKQLQKLSLRGFSLKPMDQQDTELLKEASLDALVELRLAGCRSSEVAGFLRLRMPKLQKLRVAFENQIVFRNYWVHHRDEIEPLTNLKSISLHHIKSGPAFFDFLTRSAPNVDYLAASMDVLYNIQLSHFPKITTLTSVDCTPSIIRPFVESRKKTLQTVNLNIDNMGIPGSSSKQAFIEIEEDLRYLYENVTMNRFGITSASKGLQKYASWRAKEEGGRLTDAEANIQSEAAWS